MPQDRWEAPAPCEGWVARDIVRHLVEWLPGFFYGPWGLDAPRAPSVDDDPVAAWIAVRDVLQTGLDDPAIAESERDSPAGTKTFEDAVTMFCLADVLVHTWDLARATGQDERLDPDEVHRFAGDLLSMDPAMERGMRDSGHFGPRVEVADGADEQTQVLAFMGRRP